MERPSISQDVHQNPPRLSLCGKIISFSCKRVTAGERTELIFCTSSFQRGENAFLKAAEGSAVISRKTAARVDVVACRCVLDLKKRLTSPCILVSKKSERKDSFQYSVLSLSSSNRLESCIEFKLPYPMEKPVCILQGPTVLWKHKDGVFYTSLQAGGVKHIPIQLSHCVIAQLPLHKAQIFVLGMQNSSDQSPDGQLANRTLGYFIEDGQVFDGSVVLPHPYICITQCILVLSAVRVNDVLQCALVAATSSKQLVYFENAAVKDTCELPFEQPETIQMVNTGRNGCLFLITFRLGHICTVWKETFEVASVWSGVSSVHVDDFLGCGTDQMLLVFGDGGAAEQSLDSFLITDLCGISYSRGQDTEATTAAIPLQENNFFTLQALESRLQNGLTILQDLQQEVRVKDRVLQQSVQTLVDVAAGKEPVLTQHEQEGLVSLWDSDDKCEDEALDDKMREMPAEPSNPRVDKLWHRITVDRLIVGVILTSGNPEPVASVSLSILTETSPSSAPAVIQTHSQVLWLPVPGLSSASSSSSSSSSSQEPAAKRSRRHSASRPNNLNTSRLAVTAATALTPLLNSGCVKCRVMLHYVQRQDASVLASSPTPAALLCGDIDLDIHNDFQTQLLKNPQVNTDEAQEDLLSLLTVLDRWVFLIDSPDYSLGDIRGWIQKSEACETVEVSPQYLLLAASGPSAPLLVRWHPISPFQGELSIHSSQVQMLQFLDSLLAYLPASSSIHAVRDSGRGQGAARVFASALEKEVTSLKENVSLLLCQEDEEEMQEQEEQPETGSVEGLQRCREMWQKDMERSRRRWSPLVDVGRYRKLIGSMVKAQMEGDLAAILDTQRTFLS